jgi:hypothetical protein
MYSVSFTTLSLLQLSRELQPQSHAQWIMLLVVVTAELQPSALLQRCCH